MRRFLPSLVGLLVLTCGVSAQTTPLRLRWTPGQVLLYKIEHTTEAVDVSADNKSETKTSLTGIRRWEVKEVDANGVATLQMSITSMVTKRITPSGEALTYDSTNPDNSTPVLREAMAKYVNTPLAVIRVDPFGKVVEVKETKTSSTGFENELPFLVPLPPSGVKVNDTWERNYKLTLPPPVGTGEKHDAVQKYRCKSVTPEAVSIVFSTELLSPPAAALDCVPLWQLMPDAEVVFDVKNGRMHAARLVVNKELKNHQGENSSMSFKSVFAITYIGDR